MQAGFANETPPVARLNNLAKEVEAAVYADAGNRPDLNRIIGQLALFSEGELRVLGVPNRKVLCSSRQVCRPFLDLIRLVLNPRRLLRLVQINPGRVQSDQYVKQVREIVWENCTRKFANRRWEKNELYDYGIFRKSDNLYMGNVGVHSIQWKTEVCELGYWILGDFEGQGYVSEAVRAIEQACFANGFERVEIRCSSVNFRSASVPMRLGFLLEGTLRSNQKDNGIRRNTLLFARLRSEG